MSVGFPREVSNVQTECMLLPQRPDELMYEQLLQHNVDRHGPLTHVVSVWRDMRVGSKDGEIVFPTLVGG